MRVFEKKKKFDLVIFYSIRSRKHCMQNEIIKCVLKSVVNGMGRRDPQIGELCVLYSRQDTVEDIRRRILQWARRAWSKNEE